MTAPDVEASRRVLLRWRNDPVAFCKEALGVQPWSRQVEILEAIRDYRNVFVASGHAVGKDFVMACVVVWWVTTREGIVVTTANTADQLKTILWGEIRDRVAKTRTPLGGDLKPAACFWEFGPKWYAIGLTARDTNALQGKHAANVLAIGDEAAGLPPWVFLALSGCATGENDRKVYIGNLTCGPEHDFAKAVRGDPHIPGVHKVIRIPAWESPNVKAGKTVIPGLATQAYIDEIVRMYGKDSAIYNARVAATDPTSSTSSLIGYQHINAAHMRRLGLPDHWRPHEATPRRLGCDVARYGRHTTRIWLAQGPHAERIETITKMDGPTIAARLVFHFRALKCDSIAVDGGGLGSGVVDSIRDLQRRKEAPPDMAVFDINFGSGPSVDVENEVGNKRTELYWRLRDWLYLEAAVTLESGVVEELIAPTYAYQGKPQRVYLEPKEELEKRMGRSPDDADALALAVAGHLGGGASMFTGAPPAATTSDPYADPDPGDESDMMPAARRAPDVYGTRGTPPWRR